MTGFFLLFAKEICINRCSFKDSNWSIFAIYHHHQLHQLQQHQLQHHNHHPPHHHHLHHITKTWINCFFQWLKLIHINFLIIHVIVINKDVSISSFKDSYWSKYLFCIIRVFLQKTGGEGKVSNDQTDNFVFLRKYLQTLDFVHFCYRAECLT